MAYFDLAHAVSSVSNRPNSSFVRLLSNRICIHRSFSNVISIYPYTQVCTYAHDMLVHLTHSPLIVGNNYCSTKCRPYLGLQLLHSNILEDKYHNTTTVLFPDSTTIIDMVCVLTLCYIWGYTLYHVSRNKYILPSHQEDNYIH